MRNATAYGVSSRTRFDLVVNNLSGWAHTAGIIKVMSDGTPWRPLVHIEDISRAALPPRPPRARRSTTKPSMSAAMTPNYQVRDIAQAVKAAFPAANLEITAKRAGIRAPTRSISPRR